MNIIVSSPWKRGLVAAAALVLLGPGAPSRADSQQVVAVLDFNDAKLREVGANAQNNLLDMLTTSISNGTGIKVVDKESVARIKVKETAYQQSGFADPKAALTFTKELKANFVVVGAVSQASKEEREVVGITRIKLTVGVEIKAMDDKTGQIVASASGVGEANTTAVPEEGAEATDLSGLYVKAARKAIEQAGPDLAKKIQGLKK